MVRKRSWILTGLMLGACLILAHDPPELFAQKKKIEPPPRHIGLPQDSTRARKTQASEPKKKPDPLKLPDVTVYGQHKISREMGTKRALSDIGSRKLDAPPTQRRFISFTESPSDKISRERRPAVQPSQIEIYGGAGNFQSGWGGILAERQFSRAQLSVGGAYERTAGQYPNQARTEGTGVVKVGLPLSETVKSWARLSYRDHEYGLHGARSAAHKRVVQSMRGEVGLQWLIGERSKLGLDASAGRRTLDPSGTIADSSATSTPLRLSANIDYVGDRWMLSAGTRYNAETSGLPGHDLTQLHTQMWTSLNYHLSDRLAVEVRGAQETIWLEGEKAAELFSPSARVSMGVHSALWLFASVERRLLPVSYWHKTDGNPYLLPVHDQRPGKEKLGLKAGMELQMNDNLTLKVWGAQREMEDYRYFAPDTASGLFTLGALDEVRINQIHAGLVLNSPGGFKMNLGLDVLTDKVQWPGKTLFFEDVPYLPRFAVPLEARFEGVSRITLRLTGRIVGQRKARLGEEASLQPYIDFGLHSELAITDHVSFFARFQNLTSQEFEVWESYPAQGLTGIGGMAARW